MGKTLSKRKRHYRDQSSAASPSSSADAATASVEASAALAG